MDEVMNYFNEVGLPDDKEDITEMMQRLLTKFSGFLNASVHLEYIRDPFVILKDNEEGVPIYSFQGEPSLSNGACESITDRQPLSRQEFANKFRISYRPGVIYEYMSYQFKILTDDYNKAQLLYMLTCQTILSFMAGSLMQDIRRYITSFDTVPITKAPENKNKEKKSLSIEDILESVANKQSNS